MFERSLFGVPLIVVLTILLLFYAPVSAQGETDCDIVSDLMQERAIPDVGDLRVADGGQIISGNSVRVDDIPASIPVSSYAHIWTIPITDLLTDDDNILSFYVDDNDAPLEVELFLGVRQIRAQNNSSDVDSVGGQDFRFTIRTEGTYTLIIRRKNIMDTAEALSYILRDIILPSPNQGAISQPFYHDVLIPEADIDLFVHHNDADNTYSYSADNQYILFFESPNSFVVNDWATSISLLGGDLSLYGADSPTGERILYIESFDASHLSRSNANGNVGTFSISNEGGLGLDFEVNWQIVHGVWMLDDCTGVLLRDGNRFIADTTNAQARQLTLQTVTSNEQSHLEFTVNRLLNVGAEDGIQDTRLLAHSLITHTTTNEVPAINVFLDGRGVYQLSLPDERHLDIQANSLDLSLVNSNETYAVAGTVERLTGAGTHRFRVDLDWSNIDQLEVASMSEGYTAQFRFTDTGREGQVASRSAENLHRFEVRDQVILIDYGDANNPQEQRLLLPAEESFIELVMLEGQAFFDTTAFPHQAGFMPNASNNLGGECYPVNTILPEINCAPNGHPNPANGNLWYAVTDLSAQGYLLDLNLTRSYNSYDSQLDGLFGLGWTSDFLLDYNVPFTGDSTQTREVDLTEAGNVAYRVALDMTWMPSGVITVILPSGSRHIFREIVPQANQFRSFASDSMSGWTLSQARATSGWVLEQPSGLAYHYDRAGRLRQFGYDFDNSPDRMVTIEYPYNANGSFGFAGELALNGAGGTDNLPIIISDSSLRQIELYFDDSHHVEKSRLVPVENGVAQLAPSDLCDINHDCFETEYRYDDAGHLIEVHYADGQFARYQYEGRNGELSLHYDPRAPEFPAMQYEYVNADEDDAQGIEDIFVLAYDEGKLVETDRETHRRWRRLEIDPDCDTLCTEVIDETGSSHHYIYNYGISVARNQCTERSNRPASFTLASVSYLDASYVPRRYRWDVNRLEEICAQDWFANTTQRIRNSMRFTYPDTAMQPIGAKGPSTQEPLTNGQFAGFDIRENSDAGASSLEVLLADSTRLGNVLGSDGTLESIISAYGAVTEFDWQDDHVFASHDDPRSHDYRYNYNDSGLITQVEVIAPDPDRNNPYFITYDWDAFGRITGMIDPSAGLYYRISYSYIGEDVDCLVTGGNSDRGCLELQVDITDAVGTISRYRFDLLNRLIGYEVLNQQEGAEDEVLRYEAYRYNDENMYFWHEISTVTSGVGAEEQTRQYEYAYRYEAEDNFCSPLPTDADVRAHTGLRVTSAGGQVSLYCYDALDRIMLIVDELGNVITYDYQFNGFGNNNIGMRIIEYDTYRDRTVHYDFDNLNSRLLEITIFYSNGEEQRWDFRTTPYINQYAQFTASTLQTSNRSPSTNFSYFNAYNLSGEDDDEPINRIGRLFSASINQINAPQAPAYALNDPSIQAEFDPFERLSFLGYDLNDAGVAGDASEVIYCARPNGMIQVFRFDERQGSRSCNSAIASASEREIWLDQYNRVHCIRYEEQVYFARYNLDSTNHIWQVTVDFYSEGTLPDCRALMRGEVGAGTILQDTWLATYNTAGDLRTWRNESNVSRTYCYDSLGRLTSLRMTETEYDLSCPIEAAVDAGTALQYLFDSDERNDNSYCPADLPEQTWRALFEDEALNTSGQVTIFAYDENNNLRWQYNELGQGTQYTYNSLGQVLTQWDCPNRETTSYVYGLENRLENIITAQGNLISITYDQNNPDQIASVIDVSGNLHRYNWSINSNTLSYTDPQDNTTAYHYDNLGHIWRVEGAEDVLNDSDYVVQFVYDDLGALTQYHAGDFTGDASDDRRILAIQYAGENIILGAVARDGDLTDHFATSPDGIQIIYALPLASDAESINPDDVTVSNTMMIGSNAIGQLVDVRTGLGDAIQFTYDAIGRLHTLSSDPTDDIDFYELDWSSTVNQLCVTSIDGEQVTFEYNEHGQILHVWDDCSSGDMSGNTPLVSYFYDDSDLLVDDPLGTEYVQIRINGEEQPILVYRRIPINDTEFSVEPASAVIDTPGHRLQYELDSAGLITNITDVSCLANALEISFSEIPSELSEYCVFGGRDAVRIFETQIDYNDYGFPLTIIDSEQGVQTFVYDVLGNLDNYQNASRDSFDYVYDELNRLKYINNSNNVRLWLDYNPHGQVTGICRTRNTSLASYGDCVGNVDSNLLLEEYSYDDLGRLESRSYYSQANSESAPQRHTLCYNYNVGRGGRIRFYVALAMADDCETQASEHLNIFYGFNDLADLRLLSNLTVSGANESVYEFEYLRPAQVANLNLSTGNLTNVNQSLSADLFGALVSSTVNNSAFSLDNAGLEGASISFDERAELSYKLNAISLLQSLNFANGSDEHEIVSVDYRVNQEGTPFQYRANWDNGLSSIVTVNDDSTLASIIYGNGLQLINNYDASNRIVRQALDGLIAFEGFESDNGGHIVTTQYEDDGRPRSMRFSQNDGGSLSISYTYDSYGRLETETRQYQAIDNEITQYRIEYNYARNGSATPNNQTQLLSREVTISSNRLSGQSLSLFAIVLFIGLGIWAVLKRRIRVLSLSFVIASFVFVGGIFAQNGESFVFQYAYDDFGNLTEQYVESQTANGETVRDCVVDYDYDGLNRLITVTSGANVSSYDYDAYNRLIAISDNEKTQIFSYLGDQDLPIASRTNDEALVFYGRTADKIPLFEMTEEGELVQILHQGNTLAPLSTYGSESPNIWLYDPLGRFLNDLDAPALGCDIDAVSGDFVSSFPLMTWNGMMWDPATNLFFDDGRVYSPSIGHYFQRRHAGPNILGNIYFLDKIASNPPHQGWESPHLQGLDTLLETQDYVSLSASLSADAILSAHYPALIKHTVNADIETLQQIKETSQMALLEQIMLPQWIQSQFGSSSIFIADGGIRIHESTAPAHSIQALDSSLSLMPAIWDDALSVSDMMQAPTGNISAVLNPQQLPIANISTYVSDEWRPDTAVIMANRGTSMEMLYPPNTILEWLLEPFGQVGHSMDVMTMGDTLDELILRPGQDWLQEAYEVALPTQPDIPIYNADSLVAEWFDTDIFGVEGALLAPLRLPDLPSVPNYQFGANLPIVDGFIED